uniref:Uncharacterized protein n=1 Tax=Entomoneis paludosa TaxID=265537 RepID=A0A6U2XVS9_9STRA|mmetsp:Transcript_14664/g.30273  ORF Transcript_14664/g.30273 Transcript_14664/m.30273 type:complete len:249 (+) Transcript_14664:3-749(+)
MLSPTSTSSEASSTDEIMHMLDLTLHLVPSQEETALHKPQHEDGVSVSTATTTATCEDEEDEDLLLASPPAAQQARSSVPKMVLPPPKRSIFGSYWEKQKKQQQQEQQETPVVPSIPSKAPISSGTMATPALLCCPSPPQSRRHIFALPDPRQELVQLAATYRPDPTRKVQSTSVLDRRPTASLLKSNLRYTHTHDHDKTMENRHHHPRRVLRSVSFDERVQVLQYTPPLERYAGPGWSQYFEDGSTP